MNRYVYVVAYHHRADPHRLMFDSAEVLAQSEDQAYDLGFDLVTTGDDYTRVNDYVHQVEVPQ